ncbi:ankyrin repeat-containing domain protein, partial [Lentinula raphanica]
ELREWLGAPDCSINYSTALNKRANGTGQWILENPTYLKWREEGSILWIQGHAGSGKTFLITSIIKDFKEIANSTIIIYHYFDTRDNSGAKTSFQGLLLSLLLQFGAQNQKIHPALKTLHELSKTGLSHSKPPNEDLIITLKKIIEDLVQKEWKIHLIIDALDECKEIDRVLGLCMQIARFNSTGIIISSRGHQPSYQQYLTISLMNNEMVAKDIALFLEEQISFKNITLNTEVKATLLIKANGGFRYADCQVQILKECANAKRVRESLTKLPSSLKEIYFGAINKSKEGSYSKEAHHLLLWLLYSFEPLYMNQVAVIFSMDLKSKEADSEAEMLIGLEKIIDTTLVTVDSKNIVQLAHASVKDFLLESNDSMQISKSFKVDAQLGHNIIAQMCLIYLLKQIEYKNICENSYHPWKSKTFEWYATQYWGEHGQYVDRNLLSCKNLWELMEIFLEQTSNAFMNWKKNFQTMHAETYRIGYLFSDCTNLHVTAWFGLETSTQKLLANPDTDINVISSYYGTALQTAVVKGNKNIVELLIQYSANVNTQGGYYYTALQAAAAKGQEDTVKYLIQQGAKINIQGGTYNTALQAAAAEGHKDTVELLIQQGAEINAQGGRYGTALHRAAVEGHKDMVEFLVQQGAEINARGGYHGTALQAAVDRGNREIVKSLVQQGAEINAQNEHYGTALQRAAVDGHKDIVKFLVQHGAEINTQGGNYGTALQAAAVRGHKDIVEFLVQQGAEINTQGGHYSTALQAAAAEGHKDIVEYLVQQGAYINTQGGNYGTALQAAAAGGYKAIVEMLSQQGAQVNVQGGCYGTALQGAAVRGHKDIAKFLVQCGADINAQGGKYDTALQAAAFWGHKDLVEFLVQQGANINAQDGNYGNALQAAAVMGHKDTVEFLIQQGAEINAQGGKYNTAIQAAAAKGHKDTVEFLVQQGAEINAQGGYYGTVLQTAVAWGWKDIVKSLVQQGAEINAQGGHYGTALHRAAVEGHKDIVKLLVQQGAEINAQDENYSIALQAAVDRGHKDIVKYLIQHGACTNAHTVGMSPHSHNDKAVNMPRIFTIIYRS